MSITSIALESRVLQLERTLRRDRALAVAGLALAISLGAASVQDKNLEVDTLSARRVVVLDDQARPRIVLGQDPKDTQRRSRGCGMQFHDATGAERFGVSTLDDLSVVMGFDAPHGVGDPMRDRVGIGVAADGSAHVMLINNKTLLPVRLISDADGSGGIEFFDYDLAKLQVTVTRLNHKGESKSVVPLGERK